jgi:hypothetical protein
MDPVRNPFAPGAGNPPPELAGRGIVLDDMSTALQRIAIGRHAQSSILVGLRGVGKTVLLVRIKDLAEGFGYRTHFVEAHEGKTLPELLTPGLRSVLFSLSTIEGAKEAGRRGLRVLRSFISGLKVTVNDVEFGLGIDPEPGSADSGDIEADLPNLFVAVGQAAKAAQKPVAILVDELQYLTEQEFSALIMSVHKVSQSNLPVTIVGAGLPQILGLAGESKSYAERLFRYPKIGALEQSDARDAIRTPIEGEGARIEEDALDAILDVTERYPYFLQQWGYDAWNIASDDVIRLGDVKSATDASIKALDESFFRVRFDRCTPAEKRYMRALADFGPGSHRSGDIADKLNLKTTSVGPIRGKLIKKGMIYSPQHGDTAFTVPLFDAYMRRVMPNLT